MLTASLRLITTTALLATAAFAQEGRLLFQLSSPGSGGAIAYGGYAQALTNIGDVNGDGWQDIVVGHPTSQGPSGSGRIHLVSGHDGTLIHTCLSTQIGYLGVAVAAVGDVNGDLVPDLVGIGGSSLGSPTGSDIAVFSGSNGSVLFHLAVAATAIAAAGDWNGDLVPDFAYVDSGNLQIAAGATGATIASLGSADQLAAITSSPIARIAARSGNTVTMYVAGSSPAWSVTGYSKIASAGDYNGDQLDDVLALSGNNVQILSGADGSALLTAPVTGTAALCGGTDLDGDGTLDFVTGDPAGRGFVRAYSGANGSLLFAREGQEVGEAFGTAVAMHPGAGTSLRTSVLVGVPYMFTGSDENGALQVVAQALPGELDGSFRPFGQFCNFTSTQIRPGGALPTIGQTYAYRFNNNTSPVGFEMLAYGLSNTAWNGVPLPLTIPSVLSCQLFVSADALVASNPSSSYGSLGIPLNAALSGYTLYLQAFNVSGYPLVEASNAAKIVIGN
ncbi:MAG: hypothetical protein ACI9OJ_004629 [Myxococcota bacterium]|jgi:hypothetical protein